MQQMAGGSWGGSLVFNNEVVRYGGKDLRW